MTDPIIMPSKSSFVIRVLATIKKYSRLIEAAPVKKGWDPIFRQRVAAKWSVKSERNACIQEISDEATIFGYDLSMEFNNFKSLTEEVEQE